MCQINVLHVYLALHFYQTASLEHLQTSLWPPPWLCRSERGHPAATTGQRTPAVVKYIINKNTTTTKHNYFFWQTWGKQNNIVSHTSLIMLILAWSKGAGLPRCLKWRSRAFSLSSHWAAALLWDLWISCRWLWSRMKHTCKYVCFVSVPVNSSKH